MMCYYLNVHFQGQRVNPLHGNAIKERRSNSARFLANYERKFTTSSKLPSNVGNVKCILEQALRLCTGRTAHRPFHDHGTRRGKGSASRPGRSLPLPTTLCTGGWVGPRAGVDRCRKSRPHRDSILGPSSP